MFTVIALFFKSFFSGALWILKLIFSDWRILLAVIFLAFVAFSVYEWDVAKKELAIQVAALEQRKTENETLQKSNRVLIETNAQNVIVIEQVKKDQQEALIAVKKLNTDLAASSKKISDLKGRLENIKTPPTPLSPYLAEAINGIQKLPGEDK